jgi:TonB family protein
MSGDKGRGPLPEGENYESVVLNFLDREMAAAQPADKNRDHSDDLDALVSDLLRQVISESDQTDSRPAVHDETESLLAEFPPVEVGPLEANPPVETAARSYPDPSTREAPETGPAAREATGGMELAALEAESEMEMAIFEAQSAKELAGLEAEPETNPEDFKMNPETESGTLEAQSEMAMAPPEAAPAPPPPAAREVPGAESAAGRQPAATKTKAAPVRTQPAALNPEPEVVKAEAGTAPAAAEEKGTPALFAVAEKPKSRKSALTVAAACLLAAAGFGAYHFLGGPGEAPPSLASAPAVTDPAAAPQAPADPVVARAENAGSKPQPAPVGNHVEAAPVTIKAEAAAPVAAEAPVPAPPRDERPGLLRGTDQIADASRRSAIESLIPSHAPGRSAPAAPRPPRPPPAQKAAAAAPQVSGALIPAVPISQVTPKYPEIAVRTRTSAVVELDIVIDPNGRVIDATPASGPTMFHKDAVDAAMKWRYRPASIGGDNVQSQARITMKFNLR